MRYSFEKNRIDKHNERSYEIVKNKKHYYLKSVTTILGIISKGHNFDEWLKNMGHNSEIIMDRAGKFGTAVHQVIEDALLGNQVSTESIMLDNDQQIARAWERFITWCRLWREFCTKNEVEVKSEGVEYIAVDLEEEYAGTVDLMGKMNGEYFIADHKTGNHIGNKEKLQMVAYMRALEKEYDIKIPKAYLFWMPSKYVNQKGYRVVEVENSDALWIAFKAAKDIYHFEHKNEKPKFMSFPDKMTMDNILDPKFKLTVNRAEV